MRDDFNWDDPAFDNQTGSSNNQSDFSSEVTDWDTLGSGSSDDLWEDTSGANNSENFANFSEEDTSWQGNQQQQSQNWGNTPTETDFNSSVKEDSPKQFNFGFKQVGLILASIFVVIALILLVLSKVNIKKNEPKGVNSSTTEAPVDENDSNMNENYESNNTVQSNNSGVSLLEIPSDTAIDYSGDILSTNGTVAEKRKLLKDTQVVYCVDIRIVFGSYSQTVSYFCNYDSFNKVSKGDIVIVEYQQVSSNCISINSISK